MEPHAKTLSDLSEEIEAVSEANQRQIDKARIEAETNTRLRPAVKQDDIGGLFEAQKEMF